MNQMRTLECTDGEAPVATETPLDGPAVPRDVASASVAVAQARARKWADRALELSQSGEVDQAAVAEAQAEVWLARMLAGQAQIQPVWSRRQSRPTPRYRYAPTAGAIRMSARADEQKDLRPFPAMDRATIANSVVLRAWKGPPF